jgi:hypothetical protein
MHLIFDVTEEQKLLSKHNSGQINIKTDRVIRHLFYQ